MGPLRRLLAVSVTALMAVDPAHAQTHSVEEEVQQAQFQVYLNRYRQDPSWEGRLREAAQVHGCPTQAEYDRVESERQAITEPRTLEEFERHDLLQFRAGVLLSVDGRCEERKRQEAAELARREAEERQALAERHASEVLERMVRDPKAVQLAISTNICVHQAERNQASQTIAEERRGARVGGVVDLALLHEMQDGVVYADGKIREQRGLLKAKKLSALPCSHPGVQKLWGCSMSNGSRPGCSDETGVGLVALMGSLDGDD
jgi:hypothetical protein